MIHSNFGVPTSVIGVVLIVLTAAVILSSISHIGTVAGTLVPFMAVAYTSAGLLVLLINISSYSLGLSACVHGFFS